MGTNVTFVDIPHNSYWVRVGVLLIRGSSREGYECFEIFKTFVVKSRFKCVRTTLFLCSYWCVLVCTGAYWCVLAFFPYRSDSQWELYIIVFPEKKYLESAAAASAASAVSAAVDNRNRHVNLNSILLIFIKMCMHVGSHGGINPIVIQPCTGVNCQHYHDFAHLNLLNFKVLI